MAENKNVSVIFKVKNDEFNKNLSQTKQQIKLTASEIQAASSKINIYGNNVKILSEKHKLLTAQISNVTDKMNLYKNNIDKTNEKLNKNRETLEKLSEKKKSLSNQYKEAVKEYGEESEQALNLKKSLEECKEEYNEVNNKIKDNVKSLNNSQTNLAKTEAELNKYKSQLKEVNKALSEQTNGFINAAKKFEDASKKFKSAGGIISDAGGRLMKLSSPLIALDTYAVKVGADFEQSMANLQATSGATGNEFDSLRDKAKELGKNTCKSATDSANAMQFLSLAGYNVNQILSSTEPILKASVGWGAEMKTTADLTTDSMSALGLSVNDLNHYLDICSQAQRSSNTSAIQLQEAFIGCGGTLHTLGISAEEGAKWLGILANQGKKGSEAGSNFNSMLVNLIGASSTSESALKKLGVSAWDNNGNFIGLTKTIYLLKGALDKCTPQQKALFEAQIGGKTQLDTLNMLLAGCGEQYDNLSSKIDNCNGVTSQMYDIMNNTTQGKIEAFKSKLEALGIQLSDNLLPHLNDLLDVFGNVLDWFSSLDKGTQKIIINTGLLSFATGGLLKSIGSTSKGIGTLLEGGSKVLTWLGKTKTATETTSKAAELLSKSTGSSGLTGSLKLLSGVSIPVIAGISALTLGFYAASEGEKVLNGNILQSKDNMSLMERAMASLMGIQRYTNEELENMGIKYKEFSSSIAPETKASIENIADKFRDLQLHIDKMDVSKAISEEDKNNLVTKADDLVKSVLEKIDSLQSEAYNKLKETFNIDGVIDENEKKILDGMDSGAKQIKDKVVTIQNEIHQLEQNGAMETVEGRAEINSKLLQLQDIYSNELLAKEKANQQDIQAFRSEANSLDLQKAQELLKSKADLRDEEINQTKGKYDEAIQLLKNHLEECSGEEAAATQKQLDILIKQRDDELNLSKSKYDEWLNVINEKYPEIANEINRYNGEMLSEHDKHCQDVLSTLQGTYEGIESITESGTYTLRDKYTNTWDTITVKTDEATGEIIGIYDNYNGAIGGYTLDICNDMKKQAKESEITANDVSDSFGIMANASVNEKNQIVNSNGDVIGSLDRVRGKAGETRSGFIELNGTPIKVTCDSNGAITNLNEVIRKADAIPRKKTMTVSAIFEAIGNGVKSLFGFAEGGTVQNKGVYTINERGFELFDSISSNAGISLNSLSGGYETAYLNSNTKVTNSLMTTSKMNREIEKNADIKTAKAINNLVAGLSSEIAVAFKNINIESSDKEINPNITLIIGGREYNKFLDETANGVVKIIDKNERKKRDY